MAKSSNLVMGVGAVVIVFVILAGVYFFTQNTKTNPQTAGAGTDRAGMTPCRRDGIRSV